MNPFESGTRKLIPAVLIYAEHGDEILMLHRSSNPNDFHQGKWNGLGGKLETDESPLECAIREFREEAGIEVGAGYFQVLGVLQFPNFKPRKQEDWLVYVFCAKLPEKRTPGHCAEGELKWVAKQALLELNLWEGDRHFLPYVLAGKSFLGTIWYHDGKVDKLWMEPL